LTQKVRASGKLRIKLIVEVVAVGHDNDGRRVQRFLKQAGLEHHRQGFSAALRMPENSALTVGFRGLRGRFHGFTHGTKCRNNPSV
jgi:hypothetical protein